MNTETPQSKKAVVALLRRIYSLPHWIELIRLVGYQQMAVSELRDALKPLSQKHGESQMREAAETLVEVIEVKRRGKRTVHAAQLKPHIARLAFQILGPRKEPK
jgi:hypothetical protein